MATSGQLKTRIDRLTKKIAEKGPSLGPEKRRADQGKGGKTAAAPASPAG